MGQESARPMRLLSRFIYPWVNYGNLPPHLKDMFFLAVVCSWNACDVITIGLLQSLFDELVSLRQFLGT